MHTLGFTGHPSTILFADYGIKYLSGESAEYLAL
jgi:hypothetical protein